MIARHTLALIGRGVISGTVTAELVPAIATGTSAATDRRGRASERRQCHAVRPCAAAEPRLHPLAHRLERHVQHRDQEHADRARRRSCRRTPPCRPRAGSASPRPCAQTSGIRPRMNAIEVIITARNRMRAPSTAASRIGMPGLALLLGELDDQDAVLRRQRDQHHQADLRIEIERQPGRSACRRTRPARRR